MARIGWLKDMFYNEENLERVRRFKSVADRAGCSRSQLALAWAAAQPGLSGVILGVGGLEQLRENLGALRVEITPEISRLIDDIFPAGVPASVG